MMGEDGGGLSLGSQALEPCAGPALAHCAPWRTSGNGRPQEGVRRRVHRLQRQSFSLCRAASEISLLNRAATLRRCWDRRAINVLFQRFRLRRRILCSSRPCPQPPPRAQQTPSSSRSVRDPGLLALIRRISKYVPEHALIRPQEPGPGQVLEMIIALVRKANNVNRRAEGSETDRNTEYCRQIP